MEIYTNASNRTLKLEVPVNPTGSTMDVGLYKNGALLYDFPNVFIQPVGTLNVTLPYLYVQHEDEYIVKWSFEYNEANITYNYEKEIPLSVVTPYVSLTTMREMFSEPGISPEFTDNEMIETEKIVRNIINIHCRQTFGKTKTTHEVRGNGNNVLGLPARCFKVTKFNGISDAGVWFDIKGDGWWLATTRRGVPPLKADFYGLHMHTGGVIHNPNNVNLGLFSSNFVYTIEGEWGWPSVPEPIKQAARLLINDYIGDESQYRDRYLTSMTAADWRLQFNSGAFTRTGNVRADALLSDYIVPSGWYVI